ncbi:MAG: DeoR family transcriptional regulator [Candidatus Spechtbacterales bacterium]|nr:DeoR family transcriptional regulator [Candidatus Spechtbacterales bacterium]
MVVDINEENNPDLQNKREYMYALVLAVYRITDKFPRDDSLRLKMREEAVNVLSHLEHIYQGSEPDRYKKFVNSVQTLVHYCEVAQHQNWVNRTNFAVLKHELFKLRNSIEMPEQVEKIPQMREASYEVNLRKNKEADSSSNNKAQEPSKNSSALYAQQNGSANNTKGASRGLGSQSDATLASTGGAGSSKRGISARQQTIIEHLKQNGKVQAADLADVVENVSTRTIRRDLDKLIKKEIVQKEGKTNGARYYLA